MPFRPILAALLPLLCLPLALPHAAHAQTPTDASITVGATEPPPYTVGQTIDLIGIFQSGAGDSFDAELNMTATDGITFVSVTPVHPTQPFSCSHTARTVSCSRDMIRGSSEIFVETRFDEGGTQTITAEAVQSNPDPNPGNNEIVIMLDVEGGEPEPGALSGTKWHDLDQDGTRDGGEPGLAGWTIYVDENGNGERDGGEPSATTGGDGSYQIDDLEAGTYTVREVLQNGWQQTFPAGGSHTVSVDAGETTTGVDFGNAQNPQSADLGVLVRLAGPGGKAAARDTSQVSVGDTLDVEVEVNNSGPDDAEGITLTLVLDDDGNVLVVVPGSPEPCDGGGSVEQIDENTIRWDVDQLPDGGTLRCGFRVSTVEPGTATMTGSVTATTDDPDTTNNTGGLVTVVEEMTLADLAIDKSVAADSVFVGDTLTYTVSVLNRGPDDAPNTRVRDVVFADSLAFISPAPQGCTLSQNNGQLDCILGTLAPGQTVSIQYRARTKLAGRVSNLVDATSDAEDPNVENNVAEVRVLVRGGADVSVEKIARTLSGGVADSVFVGEQIEYTVTVTNRGPEPAFLVETDDLVFADSLRFIADLVPENCTLGTATDDDTGRALSTMQCRHAAILDPGESESATYRAVATQAGTVTNEVEVTAFPRDLNPANNLAVVATVVQERTAIDFSLDASASPESAREGDTITFRFSCSPDASADACTVTATASEQWTTPVIGTGLFVAQGDTMTVQPDDEITAVEIDPEGFPAGTTRITHTFTGGYSEGGEAYVGTFTLVAGQAGPGASVRFEASAENNDDPNGDDDVIEILVNIDALATATEPEPGGVPAAFRLHANYPNPFNPETTIPFDVPARTHVRLTVFNTLGQRVATLVDEPLAAGRYRAAFGAADLPSGLYLYRLEAGAHRATKTMVLLK